MIERVSLIGGSIMPFKRTEAGLEITMPLGGHWDYVPILRIDGKGLV